MSEEEKINSEYKRKLEELDKWASSNEGIDVLYNVAIDVLETKGSKRE